jgi:hypothetical protein
MKKHKLQKASFGNNKNHKIMERRIRNWENGMRCGRVDRDI